MTQPPQTGPAALAAGPAPGMVFARALPRLIAYLVDGFITSLLMIVVAFVLGTVVGLAGSAGRDFIVGLGIILFFLAFLGIWLLYFPFFWGRGGQTPGAKLMKIRVVSDEDGSPIGMGTGFVRLFGYFVSGLVFSVGFIWILIDLRRRGWHDLIAGTCVVKA
ncbi:MAG TPA: RDD family protein [Candidatus Limnocylindrales bacterium]|nr:RDD family protein [Candidatus Limnocylindrales bacterium]